MGNKLCGPLLKKTYRHDEYPWHLRKDSHLLRLWAEVFKVHGDGDYMRWERVSEDVVPINISCVEDSTQTVYQITAYSRHVEKVFDVKIVQPGTIICPATESFVHWRDTASSSEWGLNFTSPVDAKKFRECCSFPPQSYARRASSAGSLRLSPPKRLKNKSISSPNSPTHGPRRTISSPEEFDKNDATYDPLNVEPSPSQLVQLGGERARSTTPKLGTEIYRTTSPENSSRSVTPRPRSDIGRSVSPRPRVEISRSVSPRPGTEIARSLSPRAETEISRSLSPTSRSISPRPKSESSRPISPKPISPRPQTETLRSATPRSGSELSRSVPPRSGSQLSRSLSPRPEGSEVLRCISPRPGKENLIPVTQNQTFQTFRSGPAESSIIQSKSQSAINNSAFRKVGNDVGHNNLPFRKSLPPVYTYTSRMSPVDDSPSCAVLLTSQLASGYQKCSQTDSRGDNTTELNTESVNVIGKPRDNIQMETAFIGDVIRTEKDLLKVDENRSRKTSSSSSPEWPSPPEPLTPLTPMNPSCSMNFDSDCIKRLLQSLPASPVDKENDLGFHEDSIGGKNVHAGSSLTRTRSLTMHDRESRPLLLRKQRNSVAAFQVSASVADFKLGDVPKKKFPKSNLEYELQLRNKCIQDSYVRDSYPDSGIGGMSGEAAGSVASGGSIKSDANPSVLDPHHDPSNGSTGDSTHESDTSSHHSDIINQLTEGSEVKQFLSTELSDEEGADSDGSIHTMAESTHSQSRQAGATRKAGWLVVKNWLVHKKRKIELAGKRNWRSYWVCLKGTTLLFFDCDEERAVNENSIPKHILVIEGGLAQAVPEHPKRDNIFSLSSAFGDAYLFQAQTQIELENWIGAIHSACASSFARQHGKDNTLKLLKNEILKLDTNIDVDVKMKKMAELQLTVVSDPKSRTAIIKQIAQWEENLEKLYIEQYRFRCYVASLQGSELPNPKVLLANASKVSKTMLGKLGIFTVSSFHALVSARKPLVLPNINGKGTLKGGLLSPKSENVRRSILNMPSPVSPSSDKSLYKSSEADQFGGELYHGSGDSSQNSTDGSSGIESLSRVGLPNNQTILCGINKKTTVQDLIEFVCSKRQLNPRDHYVRLKLPSSSAVGYLVPEKQELIKKLKYEAIEICQKSMFQIELHKQPTDKEFGFAVEAELADDVERDDQLEVYVSDIKSNGIAHKQGLMVGDEVLVINGKVVSELDMVFIETLLLDSLSLCLTVRSIRPQKPYSTFMMEHADAYIDNMTCPPPPSQSRLSEKSLDEMTVPAPDESHTEHQSVDHHTEVQQKAEKETVKTAPDHIQSLLKCADQVTAICRDSLGTNLEQMDSSSTRNLSEAGRLRKVILELIDTERGYVKDLNCLIERYLEPLKEETFLTSDDIDQLFGNIQEIVVFQKQFLQSLEEAIALEKEFYTTEDVNCFRRVLFSLGGSFLYYANHFKVYSSFCASHSRSQKMLNPEINATLREFLTARNPKQQHSSTLESFLIKPIQRILKYPLLLQQLCHLTDRNTDEHNHLSEALRGMEAVAEHINEMQKIYEEHGSVFDELSKSFRDLYPHKPSVDLSVGELQMYGTVEWCNTGDYLGKIKRGTHFENIVFVFKTAVVFLCRERSKRRKSKLPNAPGKNTPESHHELVHRFRTLIPVQEVQVRCGKVSDIEGHHWWELVHSRSEADGRPERVYQFCNSSLDAKTDFMKIIRQAIRESVRRMTLPQVTKQSTTKSKYIPFGGKKIDYLPSVCTTQRTSNKKRTNKGQDFERHSMDFDDRSAVTDCDSLVRLRSKTIGDLNEVSLDEPDAITISSESHSSNARTSISSNSSIGTVSHQSLSSAKLIQASSNALDPSSSNSDTTNPSPLGSPVWKPRSIVVQHGDTLKPTDIPYEHGSTTSINVAPVYGDCSEIVYRKDTKTLIFPQQETPVIKDTEC